MRNHFPYSIIVFASVLFISVWGTVDTAQAEEATMQIVPGARHVRMLSYPLRKDCTSIALVRSMTFVYEGDRPADIRTLTASIHGKTVTARKRIDPENYTVSFHFDRKKSVGICSGASIDIFADFSRTAAKGSKHSLFFELPTDILIYEETGTQESLQAPVHGPLVEVLQKK